jgi:hypothetical protein
VFVRRTSQTLRSMTRKRVQERRTGR